MRVARTIPHRNYDLQVRTEGEWTSVAELFDFTRKEAETEMGLYMDCNPGDRFRLVVIPKKQQASEGEKRGE